MVAIDNSSAVSRYEQQIGGGYASSTSSDGLNKILDRPLPPGRHTIELVLMSDNTNFTFGGFMSMSRVANMLVARSHSRAHAD